MFIYIAGPRPDGAPAWAKRADIIEELKGMGWSVFDPWGAWGGGARPGPAVAIVNLAAVENCRVLLGYCPETATGTAIEIGYALAKGKTILIWQDDLQGAMFHHPQFQRVATMTDVRQALERLISAEGGSKAVPPP